MDTWIERNDASAAASECSRFPRRADERAPDALPPLLTAAFDQLPCAILIVTPDGDVLHANRAAVRTLESNDLRIDSGSVLAALRPADAANLRRAIAAAAGLRRTLLVLGGGDCGLAVAVQPFVLSDSLDARPRAMLLFGKSALCDAHTIGAFGRCNGLTPAELGVLDALCDGLRAKEVALRLHSSIATVRSHLRSIYHKTGSRDLHDLIARLALLPPQGPVMP